MSRIRTLSRRRLAVFAAALLALAAVAGVASAALRPGAEPPPPKPLAVAIRDAVSAPKVQGITARVSFSNSLVPAGALGEGRTSPLLAGAEGRVWARGDGRFRLELQSDRGDAQIVSDGREIRLFDAASNTVYRVPVPRHKGRRDRDRGPKSVPSLRDVERGLARLGRRVSLSGAQPGTVADRPAYTLRLAPRRDGGLVGAAELAWDAARGVPLRAALYAQGQREPVLELAATEVGYDAVPLADVNVAPPRGAKQVRLEGPAKGERKARGARARRELRRKPTPARSEAAARADAGFPVAAPRTLVGLPRRGLRVVAGPEGRGVLAVYGQGLGALLVFEQRATRESGRDPLRELPRISIEGATGTELATALGTVLRFERDGVAYTLAGSVPPAAAEAAARELR